jgi:hypothetical protein
MPLHASRQRIPRLTEDNPMSNAPEDSQRRTLLKTAMAGLAAGVVAPSLLAAETKAAPLGKPGDFDFLTGEWRIHNRYLEKGAWIEFPGEATVVGILHGVVSVEELRIPARGFAGMGLRALDVEKKVWVDHWVNAKSGVVPVPGQTGVFVDGVGTFTNQEKEGDTLVLCRGIWDRITPSSCRWTQSISRDGGKTWVDNWYMDWTRVSTGPTSI